MSVKMFTSYNLRIDKQIKLIEDDLYSTDGVWLKRHRYTAREIKESPSFSKLVSIEDKICDDVDQWRQAGSITDELEDVYRMFHVACMHKRRKLLSKIRNRPRTAWEMFIEPLTEVCSALFETLPLTIKVPLKYLAKATGSPAIKLLSEVMDR